MTFSANKPKTLNILITVDWEGRSLDEENLTTMEQMRTDFPEAPYTQYLNAAYYTKPGANAAELNENTSRVLRDHDEHGLHIHAWRRLVEDSGLNYISEPTFKNEVDDNFDAEDCGQGVPLWAYSRQDLNKLIKRSIEILRCQGFNHPKSFRSGGWMSASTVTEALIDNGFRSDSSDVSTFYVSRRWDGLNLDNWIKELWGKTTDTSQPYIQEHSHGKIWQVVDNGALADYIEGEEMWKVAQENIDALLNSERQEAYMVVGFHTETAAKFLPRLRKFMDSCKAYQGSDVHLDFITMSEAVEKLEHR